MRPFTVLSITGVLFLFLSACGYHVGTGEISSNYTTVSIPFIEGDEDGDLTAILIKNVSKSGVLSYCRTGADLTLFVKIIDYDEENIGFRYDRKKRGSLKHTVVPTETRIQIIAEVILVETATNKQIRGPTRIIASVDFDHDFYSSRNSINVFSLSQLSDIDEACDAVLTPLHEKFAQKVVDYLINS